MLLHSIYRFGKAKTRRLVTHNPCQETELPRVTKQATEGHDRSPSGAHPVAAAEERNPDAGDLILFMGSIGWRWSEAAALAVRDVEDDGEHVWVDVTRVFRIVENRQVLVEDAAKSFARLPSQPCPIAEAAAMLRRRVVGKVPGDFVFTNTAGRHWNQNTFLRDTWPALARGRRDRDRGSQADPALAATHGGGAWRRLASPCMRSSGSSATRTSRRRTAPTAAW